MAKIILPTLNIFTARELAQLRTEAKVSKALADDRIDRLERKQLLRMGYDAKRLQKLAGADGWKPMRRKMLQYGEIFKRTAFLRSNGEGGIQNPAPAPLKKFVSDAQRNPQAARLAVPGLIKALNDPRREIRFQAAEALGQMPPEAAKRALPKLLQKLESERDVDVIHSLGKAAVSIGLAPKNLHFFVLSLAPRRSDLLKNHLVAYLSNVSDRQLEAAHAELQKTRFPMAAKLQEALSEAYAAGGKELPKLPPPPSPSRAKISRSEARFEAAMETLHRVFKS